MKKSGSLFGHFDIEADGPSPSTSNMINMGVVFTDEEENIVDEINLDILPRPGYIGNEETKKWWQHEERIDEYNRIMKKGVPFKEALAKLDAKLKELNSKITWVARPANYDWMFFKCYWDLYSQDHPDAFDIGFSATCLSTMRNIWMQITKTSREDAEKLFKTWTSGLVMTHNGLDDARYQARIYHQLVKELAKL